MKRKITDSFVSAPELNPANKLLFHIYDHNREKRQTLALDKCSSFLHVVNEICSKCTTSAFGIRLWVKAEFLFPCSPPSREKLLAGPCTCLICEATEPDYSAPKTLKEWISNHSIHHFAQKQLSAEGGFKNSTEKEISRGVEDGLHLQLLPCLIQMVLEYSFPAEWILIPLQLPHHRYPFDSYYNALLPSFVEEVGRCDFLHLDVLIDPWIPKEKRWSRNPWHTRSWREKLRVGDVVDVHDSITDVWYIGMVRVLDDEAQRVQIHYCKSYFGASTWTSWLDIQSEQLACLHTFTHSRLFGSRRM